METTTGPLGLTIPVQTLSSSQEVNMTPGDITTWRNRLPMADLGNAAKKVYHAISDCNKVELGDQERFEILEMFRPLIQFICQSLSKHYVNQTNPLTKQQLTIANLAQTLQTEMANGYKLLVERVASQGSNELRALILPTALQRIIHYFTHIILRSYQLYALPPKGIWHELYVLYRFSEKNQYIKQNNLSEEYKRTLILAASFPYQWRQSEQEAIYKATETWSGVAVFRNDLPNTTQAGFLVIDFTADQPPISPTRGLVQFSENCKVLDVNQVLKHLKTLIETLEPNELKARIAHSNEPEYTVPTTVLRGLLREWGTPLVRVQERIPRSEQIKISIGLSATHYYLNGEHLFQSQSTLATNDNLSLTLPTLGIQEELTLSTDLDLNKTPQPSEKVSAYPTYTCMLVNENPSGYGLLWQGETYPPIQAGEVIGIAKQTETDLQWEVGIVRWLQQQTNTEFNIGVERLAKTAKAASAQLIKEGQPAGYFLRCLIFDSSTLLPILPFKAGSQVSVLQNNDAVPIEIELNKLLDSTGSFKLFEFSTKKALETKLPPTTPTEGSPTSDKKDLSSRKSDDDAFDSIWSNL
jgi:hypothetical protein